VLGLIGNQLQLLPIGAGTSRTFSLGSLTCQVASFLPDGQRILVVANAPSRPPRLYVMDVASGEPKPISPEGVSLLIANSTRHVSPDGKWVAAIGRDGRSRLYPIDGGEPREIPGLAAKELVIRWTPDARGLYVYQPQVRTRVEMLDLTTGRRTLWRELAPADPAGVSNISSVLIAPDGKSYVYSYSRLIEDLYLANGLK
jgi:dipeptidyl aminopeptidase/acylaminoacyl peptidase